MTDHVYGEDSYIECDYYSVVSVTSYEFFAPEFRPEHDCYCGKPTVQVARVGFHTDTTEETPGEWPTSFSRNVKVHRCEEHGFEEDNA